MKFTPADTLTLCLASDQSVAVDPVELDSLRHENQDGFEFPLRDKIEASNTPEFSTPVLIADHSPVSAAFPQPAGTLQSSK